MKRILLLFTASLLLLACSSDDDNPQPEQNTELKIQKFSRTVHESNGEVYKVDYLFDETGKMTNLIEDYFNDNTTVNHGYTYNSLNQVAKIETVYVEENRVGKTINYNYNATSNKLESIQWIERDGSVFNTINFTYEGNTVITEHEHGGKKFIFGSNGKLSETVVSGSDPGFEINTETIGYLGDLINSVHYKSSLGSSENHAFEYDDKANPLFESFNANINNYIYGFVGDMKNFTYNFSVNNYSRIEYTNALDASYNYTQIKTT